MPDLSPGLLGPDLAAGLIADGEWVNEVKLYQRLFRYLNAIRQPLANLSMVWKWHATVTTTVSDSQWAICALDTMDVDTQLLGPGDNGGCPIAETGIYMVSASAGFNASFLGNRRLLRVGVDSAAGNGQDGAACETAPTASGVIVLATTATLLLAAAGQEITVDVWQDSGGDVNTSVSKSLRPCLTVWRWA